MKRYDMKRVLVFMVFSMVCLDMAFAQGFTFTPISREKAVEVGLIDKDSVSKPTTAKPVQKGKELSKWDKIPVYQAQKVMVKDEDGNQCYNEDGTLMYHVFLIDQFGNRRSKETVKEQQKKLNTAIGNILLKTGGGAVAGGVAGNLIGKELGNEAAGTLVGALLGAGVGLAASSNDIKMAKKQKESLKQQEKLLEAYSRTFTEEGRPVDATVDLSLVEGLDMKEDNTVSMTAMEIKQEMESDEFKNIGDDIWDSF